jgi:hypothetical protein
MSVTARSAKNATCYARSPPPGTIAAMTEAKWVTWHTDYDKPDSELNQRLACVQRRIRQALDAAPAGPLKAISLCAGQGRDLLGVLADHPRAADVSARLVELDPELAAYARRTAEDAGLTGVEVVTGDASVTTAYDGYVPANLVVACGIFGNVSDADIRHTIERLPALCAPGATVVWNRHRDAPDLTPSIRSWFADNGFDEAGFDGEPGSFGVGAHRLTGRPQPFVAGETLFTFKW